MRRHYSDTPELPFASPLTPAQLEWHRVWRGQVTIANSVAQAMEALRSRR